MMDRKRNIPAVVVILILLSTGVSYGCYRTVVTMSILELTIMWLFMAIMIASSASHYSKILTDLVFFALCSVFTVSIFGLPFIYIILIIVFLAFTVRVWNASKTDKRNYMLFILLIPLLCYIHQVSESTITVNCTSVCHHNINRLLDALEKHKNDKGKYPEKLEDLVSDYCDYIPRCKPIIGGSSAPFKGKIEEKGKFKPADYSYEVNAKLDNYTIRCEGRNHEPWNIPKGYPMYNPITGLKDRPGE